MDEGKEVIFVDALTELQDLLGQIKLPGDRADAAAYISIDDNEVSSSVICLSFRDAFCSWCCPCRCWLFVCIFMHFH
jgi:hypothetical protein